MGFPIDEGNSTPVLVCKTSRLSTSITPSLSFSCAFKINSDNFKLAYNLWCLKLYFLPDQLKKKIPN